MSTKYANLHVIRIQRNSHETMLLHRVYRGYCHFTRAWVSVNYSQ